jgi:hypothetical protein
VPVGTRAPRCAQKASRSFFLANFQPPTPGPGDRWRLRLRRPPPTNLIIARAVQRRGRLRISQDPLTSSSAYASPGFEAQFERRSIGYQF